MLSLRSDDALIEAFGFSKGSRRVAFLAFDNQEATDADGYYHEENESIQVALLSASRFESELTDPTLYSIYSSISYVTPQT